MTIAILVLAAIAAAAASAAWWEARRARTPEGLVGHKVRVSTKGDTVVEGIVHADIENVRLTLRHAIVETVGSDATAPAGGLVHIPYSHLDIVQQLVPKHAEA